VRSPASSEGTDRGSRDRGQATVELALSLPLLFLFLLGIVQLVVIVRDQLAAELAAREAARAASVTTATGAAAQSAAEGAVSLRPLVISTDSAGATISVTVSHVTHTDVPLIGALIPDIDVTATATMALAPP